MPYFSINSNQMWKSIKENSKILRKLTKVREFKQAVKFSWMKKIDWSMVINHKFINNSTRNKVRNKIKSLNFVTSYLYTQKQFLNLRINKFKIQKNIQELGRSVENFQIFGLQVISTNTTYYWYWLELSK